MMSRQQAKSNALFAHFIEHAETRVIEGKTLDVWIGHLNRTCKSLGIPRGTERRVVGPLEAMGCIEILQRGAANYPTVVLLNRPPTEKLWADHEKPLTSRQSYAMLSQRVEAIEKRLGGADIGEALLNLDRRTKALESKTVDKS
jgi:hypothetical protein